MVPCSYASFFHGIPWVEKALQGVSGSKKQVPKQDELSDRGKLPRAFSRQVLKIPMEGGFFFFSLVIRPFF